jgi:hypothetical protein
MQINHFLVIQKQSVSVHRGRNIYNMSERERERERALFSIQHNGIKSYNEKAHKHGKTNSFVSYIITRFVVL